VFDGHFGKIEYIALSKTQNFWIYTKYPAVTDDKKRKTFGSRQARSKLIAFPFVLLTNMH
jgi:hypothetical protein